MRRGMPPFTPGSWAWLLAHELRLLWRSFGIRSVVMGVLALLFVALAHAGGWVMLRQHVLETMLARAPAGLALISVFTLFLALSSAFGLAVRVLFERGDTESLLASPVPISTIYAVRGMTVAAASVASLALFLLPFANMGPFVGQWEKLGAWPAIGALGLACAAVAMLGTLSLVRWLGIRRARVAAQLAGAFIGAALVLAIQAESLLPRGARDALRARLAVSGGWLASDSPLLWPVRAFMGEGLVLLAWVAASVTLFVLVVRGTRRWFLRAVQDAPQAAPARRRSPARASRPFRAGVARVVMAKELRLVRRDPALIAKTLLQAIYLIPLFIVLVRRTQPAELLASGLVLLVTSLGGTLAWITVSGEEAPELLGSAPVSLDRVRWLKVAAAMAPVAIIALPFLVAFAAISWTLAAVATVFVVLALASSGVVQVWSTPLGGAARDVRQRFRQNPFVNLADMVSSFGWAMACWLALQASPWLPVALGVGLLAPLAAWLAGRREA